MARRRVHQAKVELGERGPPWWSDPAPDLTGKRIENTPYAGSRGSRRGDPGGAGSRGAG